MVATGGASAFDCYFVVFLTLFYFILFLLLFLWAIPYTGYSNVVILCKLVELLINRLNELNSRLKTIV